MGRRIAASAALVVVIPVAFAAGCSRSEPVAGSDRTDRSLAATTTVTVPRPALPEVTPDASVEVPSTSVEGPSPIHGRVLAVDAAGSWVLRSVVGDQAVVRLDPAGAPVREIPLPVPYVTAAEPQVVDGVAWLAGSNDESGRRSFHLVRVDLVAGTAEALPSDAIVDQIDVVDGTTWVVTGGSRPATRPYSTTGPAGPATALPPRDRDLRPIVTVTPAAAFSCLAGTWTVTPHGGETRDLGLRGSGCNAVPVGDDVLATADQHVWRLSATGDAAPIDGPSVKTCAGPRQAPTNRVALVCQDDRTLGLEIHQVDLAGQVASVERALGTDLEVPLASALPRRSAPGLPFAALRHSTAAPGLTERPGVLVVLGADGAARAGTYRDPGGGWLRWSDDALWIGAGTGTWSRFPAAGATG